MINVIGVSLLALFLVFAAVGCEQSDPTRQSRPTSTSIAERDSTPFANLSLSDDNWNLALAEAKGAQEAYIGSDVDIRGKVAQILQASDTESQFAIDTEEGITFGERTLVVVGTNPKLTEEQWVRVRGVLHSYWNTENLMGAELRMPVVAAHSVSAITRAEAFPSIRTVPVDQSITRHGLTITLQKLEIAASETRLYIHAKNNSPNKASLYAYDAVLVQGTQQIVRKDVFGQDAEEPHTTLVSGTETQGILLFERVSPDSSPVRLIWEGPRTEDYSLTFDDWEWVISW